MRMSFVQVIGSPADLDSDIRASCKKVNKLSNTVTNLPTCKRLIWPDLREREADRQRETENFKSIIKISTEYILAVNTLLYFLI